MNRVPARRGTPAPYPLRVGGLKWHGGIVNDERSTARPWRMDPTARCATAAVVFDRVVDGSTLEFGTTGKLRYSDLVMYEGGGRGAP